MKTKTKIKIAYFAAALALAMAPLLCSAQGSASFAISSAKSSYEAGQTIQINILLSPNGQTFDSARIQLSYPKDLLKAQSFSFGPSFTFTLPDNGFDNATGLLSYGAGIPGGMKEATTFGTATFKVIKDGQALVSVKPSSLILSEGNNIYDGKASQLAYSLVPAPQAKPVEAKPKQPAQTEQKPVEKTEVQPLPIKVINDLPSEKTEKPSTFWGSIYGKTLLYSSAGILILAFLTEVLVASLRRAETKKRIRKIRIK